MVKSIGETLVFLWWRRGSRGAQSVFLKIKKKEKTLLKQHAKLSFFKIQNLGSELRYWAQLMICKVLFDPQIWRCIWISYYKKKTPIFSVDLGIFQWDRPRRQGPSSNRCRLPCMTIFHLKKYIYEAGWCVDVYISYINYFIIEGLMKREDTYIRFAALWIDNVFLSRSYFNEKRVRDFNRYIICFQRSYRFF